MSGAIKTDGGICAAYGGGVGGCLFMMALDLIRASFSASV